MTVSPPITTTLLLERLRNGIDEGAWIEFDQRFRGVILATALRLRLSRQDAEEAAQETMLQAFRDYQLGKYDRGRGRLSSWIIGIAHHRITDLRRRGVQSRPAEEGEDQSRNEVMQAFEFALERQIYEQAWAWIRESLGVRDLAIRVFELTALRGVPAAEVARQCGISVDQVYVTRSRTAARLREAVERFDRAVRDGL